MKIIKTLGRNLLLTTAVVAVVAVIGALIWGLCSVVYNLANGSFFLYFLFFGILTIVVVGVIITVAEMKIRDKELEEE